MNPASASRRVIRMSHGARSAAAARRCSSSADASSIQWTSSNTNSVGFGSTHDRNSAVTCSTRAFRNCSSSCAVCGVGSIQKSMGMPSRGSHGTSSGAFGSMRARSCPATSAGSVPSATPRRSRSRSRIGKYGVEDSYSWQGTVSTVAPVARARSSSTSRDFPIPGSPISSTSMPRRARAASSASCRKAISRSRPTSGVSPCATPRDPAIAPTLMAWTGSRLPFTWKGSSASVSNVVPDRESTASVARICPRPAAAMSRAARFTASPFTE